MNWKRSLKVLALGLALTLPSLAAYAQQVNMYWNTGGCSAFSCWGPVSTANPLPVTGSFSSSIAGFPGTTQTTGTPISVTTGGVTGTLPAGTVVVASNVGSTNGAFCKLGASASTSDQLIPPNSWFGFTVGTNTQITCITSTSTTTVNLVGGAGLPTGSGGGGGSSGVSTSNITQTAGTNINAAIAATGALPIDAQTTSNIYGAITAPVPCKAAATWNASTGLTGTNPTGCDGSAALWMDLGALNGVGLGSPSNYGTSPGVVSVQGVNAFVTNSPTTNGASNVTATDCSGTVATGGTAVNAFTAQTTLHGFTIFNYDTAHNDEVLWISFTTTAAASTAGSYPLPAPTATTFAGGGSFTTPPGFGLNHALSVVAATSGHAFSCSWW